MILTTKKIIPLQCRQDSCIHEFHIPQAKLMFCENNSHGIDLAELCSFISRNCKKEHIQDLKRQPSELAEFFKDAQLDFREFNLKGGNKSNQKNMLSSCNELSTFNEGPIIIDVMGEIHMKPYHQHTLKSIVNVIGKVLFLHLFYFL